MHQDLSTWGLRMVEIELTIKGISLISRTKVKVSKAQCSDGI